MIETKYRVTNAIFDIKPIDNLGRVDVSKIYKVQPVLNLGRRFRMSKNGELSIKQPKQIFKHQELTIKKRGNIDSGTPNIRSAIHNVGANPAEDMEKYLNEDINPIDELMAIGVEVYKNKYLKPRHKNSVKYPVVNIKKEGIFELNAEHKNIDYKTILSEIKKPIHGVEFFLGEPRKIYTFETQVSNDFESRGEGFYNESKTNKVIKHKKFWLWMGVFGLVSIALFGFYGARIKNNLVTESNSAVVNLENAGENVKNMDFVSASDDFAKAYQEFSKAGESMNFLGAGISSLLSDLPGAGKLKSAKNLVEAGKLMANAGQAMSDAMSEIARTNLILLPMSDVNNSQVSNSETSIGEISVSLKNALMLSQKNLKNAKYLLADIDDSNIPEDKKESFEEFKSKLPIFEKLVIDSVDYSKFLEDFVGTKGTKKYLILFQNPSELRPTGGFPGTYGVVSFKNGKLQEFKVDDVYNLDGQLKELIVPPIPLQHITPNWGMRDANWFIDFPTSARKITTFFKKESGYDVDGVITFSPKIVANILEIVGPVEMPEYGLTLDSSNLFPVLQEEVEYNGDRKQPKQVIMDLAPLMLEELYSADSEKWLEVFNLFVSSMEQKDILMYFRDLNLQSFSVDKGFSGQVSNTESDYLMITLSNIKGSKTDLIMDSFLKVQTTFETEDIKHKVSITRTHNGGNSKYGFYNKQSPTYVRVLVPNDAQFIGITDNSRPNFRPLVDYASSGFKKDEDLVRFEEESFTDKENGVTTYKEAGKKEFGFWMIINPGETKTIDLEYSVPVVGDNYQLYIQKQPGLEMESVDLSFSGREISNSTLELTKEDGEYLINTDLSKDINLSVLFK